MRNTQCIRRDYALFWGRGLVLDGATGTTYRIEHANALTSSNGWYTYGIITNLSRSSSIDVATNNAHQFYRAVWQPWR